MRSQLILIIPELEPGDSTVTDETENPLLTGLELLSLTPRHFLIIVLTSAIP